MDYSMDRKWMHKTQIIPQIEEDFTLHIIFPLTMCVYALLRNKHSRFHPFSYIHFIFNSFIKMNSYNLTMLKDQIF